MESTLLLVEDDEGIRVVASMALERLGGFRVLAVGTLAEARRELSVEPVDAVLVDLNLGDERGADLIREMRTHPAWRAIAVLVFTAGVTLDELVEPGHIGSVHLIPKPFDPVLLPGRVREALMERAPDPSPAGGAVPTAVEMSSELGELWSRHRDSVYGDLDEISRSVRASGRGSTTNRLHAVAVAHRLSGALGIYGFHDEAVKARDIERLLTRARLGRADRRQIQQFSEWMRDRLQSR